MSTNTATTWKEITLGKAGVQLQHGFTFPSGELSPDGELPVVRIGNVQRGQIVIDDKVRYAGHLSQEELSKQTINYGDILMALTGGDESNLETATGRVGRYGIKTPALLNQRVAKVVPSESISDGFLFYFLSQTTLTRHLAATANGSVQRNLTNGHVLNLEVALPPVDEQRSIAAILASLDDKIELLRKQNETLEQITQAIFNEWFVKQTADDDLPKGWKIYRIDELADVVAGYSYKGTDLVSSSSVGLVNLKNFDRNGGFKIGGLKPLAGSPKPTQEVKLGDVVVAHTDLTQDAEVLGNTAMITDTGTYEQLYISMDVAKVEPKTNISRAFLYFIMRTYTFKQWCVGYANGTTVLHLPRIAVPSYKVALPEDLKNKAMLDFDTIATMTMQKITANAQAIRTLASIRDSLLPRLMSGDLTPTK